MGPSCPQALMRSLSQSWAGNLTKHKYQFPEGEENLELETYVAGCQLYEKEKGSP